MSTISTDRSFLDLPFEIREQIYHHAIPFSRLSPIAYNDPGWHRTHSDTHRGIPSLAFTCAKIAAETLPLIYSRAILEIAPTAPDSDGPTTNLKSLFAGANLQEQNEVAYAKICSTFGSYNPDFLKLIASAEIFAQQFSAEIFALPYPANTFHRTEGQCYEAVLRFLARNTSVVNVKLSSKAELRTRGFAEFDVPIWKEAFWQPGTEPSELGSPRTDLTVRVIRIWTVHWEEGQEWEYMGRQREMTSPRFTGPECLVQMFFMVGEQLMIDPRWTTKRRLQTWSPRQLVRQGVPEMIDEFMRNLLTGRELKDFIRLKRHCRDGKEKKEWVRQMVLVSE